MNAKPNKSGSTSSTSSRDVTSTHTTISDVVSSDGILSSSGSMTSEDRRLSLDDCLDYPKTAESALSMAQRTVSRRLDNAVLDQVTSSRSTAVSSHWESLSKKIFNNVTSSKTNPVSRCCEKLQKKAPGDVTSSNLCGKVNKQMPGRNNWTSTFRSNQVAPAQENQPPMAKSSCSDNDCSGSSTSTTSSSSLKTPSPFAIRPRGRERYRIRKESTEKDKSVKEEKEEEPSVVDKLQKSLDQLDRFVNVNLKEEVFLARRDMMPRHYQRNKKLAKRYETLQQVMVFQELLVRIRQAREEKSQNNPKSNKPLDPIGEEPEEQKGSQSSKNDRLSPDGESSPDNECDSESAKTKGKSPINTSINSKSKIKTNVPRKSLDTTVEKTQTIIDTKHVIQEYNTPPIDTKCIQKNSTKLLKDNIVLDRNDDTPELDAVFRENVDMSTYEQLQHHEESSLKEGVTKETDSGNEDDFKADTGQSSRSNSKTPISQSEGLRSKEISNSEDPSQSSKTLSGRTTTSSDIIKRPESKKQKNVHGKGLDISNQLVTSHKDQSSIRSQSKSPVKNKTSIKQKDKSVSSSLQSDIRNNMDGSFYRSRSRTPKQRASGSSAKARTQEETQRKQNISNNNNVKNPGDVLNNSKNTIISRTDTENVLNSRKKVPGGVLDSRNNIVSRKSPDEVLIYRNRVPGGVLDSRNNIVSRKSPDEVLIYRNRVPGGVLDSRNNIVSRKSPDDVLIHRNKDMSRTSSPVKALTSSNTSVTDSGITSNGGCADDPEVSGDSDSDVKGDKDQDTSSSEKSDSETFCQSHNITTTAGDKHELNPRNKEAERNHIPLPEHRYRHESERMERPCSPLTDYEEDVFVPIKLKWSNQSSKEDDLGACGGSPTYAQNPYIASANDIRKGAKSRKNADQRISAERKKIGQKSNKKKEKSSSVERGLEQKGLKLMSNPKVVKPSGELLKRVKVAEQAYDRSSNKKEKKVKVKETVADNPKKKKVKVAKK